MNNQQRRDLRQYRYLPVLIEKVCKYVFRERMQDALIFLQEDIDQHRKFNENGYTVEVLAGNYTVDLYRSLTVQIKTAHLKKIVATEGDDAFLYHKEILSHYFPTVSKERFEMEADNHALAVKFIAECNKTKEYKKWLSARRQKETNGLIYLLGE